MSKGIHPGALLVVYALTGLLPLVFIAWQYHAGASMLREAAIATGLLALALLNFTLRGRSGTTIALIAGGIGIAPVIGLLRHSGGSLRPLLAPSAA